MADDGVVFDKSSALRIGESVRAYEAGRAPMGEPPGVSAGAYFEAEIVSSTVITADACFDYLLRMMVPGGTSKDGLKPVTEYTFHGRNRWERAELTGAGYSGGTGKLLPLPSGTPVLGRWGSLSDGTKIFRFSERNEPIC